MHLRPGCRLPAAEAGASPIGIELFGSLFHQGGIYDRKAGGNVQAGRRLKRESPRPGACGVAPVEEGNRGNLQTSILESFHIHYRGKIHGLVKPQVQTGEEHAVQDRNDALVGGENMLEKDLRGVRRLGHRHHAGERGSNFPTISRML